MAGMKDVLQKMQEDGTRGSAKELEEHVRAALAAIRSLAEQGERVSLVGFGSFEIRQRAARTGKNLHTGKEMQIAASKALAFRESATVKKGRAA